MTVNNELMEALTLSVDGNRKDVELNAKVNVFKNDKLNLKSISQVGLLVGREVPSINVALYNGNDTIAYACIKDNKWKVIASADDSTNLIARTGTFKSGQKDVPEDEKLLDMRFDMTHITRELILQFFPQLKVQGSSDGIRSKYQLMLIKSIKLHLKSGMTETEVHAELYDDDITQEVWDKMIAIAKAELAESA